MRKKHLASFALAVLAGPWAAAQVLQSGPVPPPPVNPGTAQAPTAPLNNPLNRNPVRRAQLPIDAPLPPPDPRDSTTRPVEAPNSFDQRDTVLQPPGQAASAASRP